ncbi:MAG: 4Fe-4S dicluster domain-containing protein [Clostridiales bacterium]|nr:4Fe-4S dicluster domain-containing protein [Clostridiales bacterium]
MNYKITILRKKSSEEPSYEQTFAFESSDDAQTVAAALILINRSDLIDIEGKKADPIAWECSCLQKKCGACAMVINGKPGLACDTKLKEAADKNGNIRIEPLRKFPTVRDLICDRSILWENLKIIKAWIEDGDDVTLKEDKETVLFDAGRCLQCGCCLEICPNFYAGGKLMGMSAMVPVSGMLQKLTPQQSKELRKLYSKHIYNGCGKSFSCRDICPAGLDIEKLMVNSNAVMLWKHLIK